MVIGISGARVRSLNFSFLFIFFLAHQCGAWAKAHQLFIAIAHVASENALMILTPPTATLLDAAFGLSTRL